MIALPSFLRQVGCTEDGILNGIEATVYNNCGWCNNDNALSMALDQIDNGELTSLPAP